MKTTIGTAVLATLLLSGGAASQEHQRSQVPQIVTGASGEARMAPDKATIRIGVQSRAATAAAATSENSRKQRAVIDAIKARGVPAEQIATTSFNVVPETQYDREGKAAPRTLTYLVVNVVTVDLRRIDQVGALIDAALAAGANQINSLQFGLTNSDSARRVALTSAVAKARADAEAMARAAGGSLGQLLELSSAESQFFPPIPFMAERAMAAAADAVPIETGQETIRATVTARWQFIQGR